MLKLLFHPDIASEVKASYDWYQEQADGLGDDYITEIESAYEAIGTTANLAKVSERLS